MTVVSLVASPATSGLGKEFAAVGTVACGLPSGRHCAIDGRLTLCTSSVSGENERVVVDVSWILAQLPELDQDDEITLELQSTTTGLRAPSASSIRKGTRSVRSARRHATNRRTAPTPTPVAAATAGRF